MKTLPEILSTPNAVELKEYELSEALLEQGVTPAVYPVLSPEAQEAIAKELMGCLPEERYCEYDHDLNHKFIGCVKCQVNEALDEVRARLTAFIGHKEQ